jgi:photosystem II stability/assembly factor-like uncharacterized protein
MKFFKLVLVLLTFLFNTYLELDAQWLKTGGPFGGTTISCFTSTGNKLYAGSENMGIFLSTDKGETWKSINSDLPDTSIISLLAYDNIIFVGTYDELFVSTNGGENWKAAGKGIPAHTRIYSIAKFDTILFAGTSSAGIFRSSDYGNTWINVHSGFLNFNTTCFVKKDNKLFAAIDIDGIFVSTDQGSTWDESLLTTSVFQSIFIKNGLIFAGSFISLDNGQSWERPDSTLNWEIYDFADIGSTIFVGTLGNGVFSSTNYGKTWDTIDNHHVCIYR